MTITAPVQTAPATPPERPAPPAARARRKNPLNRAYPLWFHIPAGVVFLVLFLVPTLSSFYFSLTRWTLFDIEFIGLHVAGIRGIFVSR